MRLVSLTFEEAKEKRLTLADCEPGDYVVARSGYSTREVRRLSENGSIWTIEPEGSSGSYINDAKERHCYEVFARLDGDLPAKETVKSWDYFDQIPELVEVSDKCGKTMVRLGFGTIYPFGMSLGPYKATGRVAVPIWEEIK
jgi:hypothetical protein